MLLLNDLMLHTPATHKDYPFVKKAFEMISKVNDENNTKLDQRMLN